MFKKIISILNRVFQRNIEYYNIPRKHWLYLHLINFLAVFCFGIGAYLLCLGIGFDIAHNAMYSVMSSMLISDVIGFLVIVVPGGLGVREGVMYLMLAGISIPAVSLILPIATRIVSMLVDLFLGAIGFILLNKIASTRK